MTRTEFVERYKHLIGGLILDAFTARQEGGKSSLFLSNAMRRIEGVLGTTYDALVPPAEAFPVQPAANGKPVALRRPAANGAGETHH